MSADLFDFHRGGDGVERLTDGEKRKLTLLNPMRNVSFLVSIFFTGCHIIQWCLFSFSLQLRAGVSHGDITGPELSPMRGHSPTPEDEMLSWRSRRSKTVMNDDNVGAVLFLVLLLE